jgi:hypothetical protein
MKWMLALLFIANSALGATNVRGRVNAADGKTPYASVAVTLGNGPTVYTDHQGMFRINGVAPGSYALVIATPRAKRTFRVTAETKEFTDLAPVIVP